MHGAGMAQPAQLALPLLPYKLLYAYKLAEYGHLAQALQYLGLVRASVGSLGNKMPAALLVCNGMAAELEQRLRAHAAVSSSPSLLICILCFIMVVCGSRRYGSIPLTIINVLH